MANKIALTKNEIDNLVIRGELIAAREREATLLKRERLLFLQELMQKYGVTGTYNFDGEFLVEIAPPPQVNVPQPTPIAPEQVKAEHECQDSECCQDCQQ